MSDKEQPENEAEPELSDGQRAWLEICKQQGLDPKTGLSNDTWAAWRRQQRRQWPMPLNPFP